MYMILKLKVGLLYEASVRMLILYVEIEHCFNRALPDARMLRKLHRHTVLTL